MQKKIYFIKERVKQVAENKGIPLGKFFNEIGVSSTGFSGEKIKKGINSETIQKIISIYPDVDAHWLVTGEFKKEEKEEKKENCVMEEPQKYGGDYKDKYIEVLEENRQLNKKVLRLMESNNNLKKSDS